MSEKVSKRRLAGHKQLRVTQDNIEKGCRKDAANCMFAKAILTVIPHATHISCTTREIAWSDEITRERHKYFNPPRGAQAIIKFDRGEEIKPFALSLDEGIVIPMGWRAKHPGSTRKGRVYKKGKKAKVRYTRYRTFGAHNIKEDEAVVG